MTRYRSLMVGSASDGSGPAGSTAAAAGVTAEAAAAPSRSWPFVDPAVIARRSRRKTRQASRSPYQSPTGETRTRRSLVQHFLDGVHDRVVARWLDRRRGATALSEALAHAVVLLPPLEGRLQVDRLPLRVSVLDERCQVGRHGLGELAHQLAIPPPEVEGDQDGLHRHGGHRSRLRGVYVRRDLDPGIELGDAL